MKVWIAKYEDSYCNYDNYILGVYPSKQLAEKAIDNAISIVDNKELHTAARWRYSVEDYFLELPEE